LVFEIYKVEIIPDKENICLKIPGNPAGIKCAGYEREACFGRA
jgi:hypothetical protein